MSANPETNGPPAQPAEPTPIQSTDDRARSVRVPHLIPVCLWLAFFVFAYSDAGTNFLAPLILGYGGLLWGVAWLKRLLAFRRRRRRGTVLPQPWGRTVLYWSFEPAALLLSAAIALTGVLRPVRFHLSRRALDAYAAEVAAGRVPPPKSRISLRWVGLYLVRKTELLPGGAVRVITSSDGIDAAGFAWSPGSRPPVIGEDFYTPLTGPWYHWHQSW